MRRGKVANLELEMLKNIKKNVGNRNISKNWIGNVGRRVCYECGDRDLMERELNDININFMNCLTGLRKPRGHFVAVAKRTVSLFLTV